MKYGVYVIRDIKTGFMTPTFDINDSSAIRNFNFAVSRPDALLHACKSDFDLFKIGEYDSEIGMITSCDPMILWEGRNVE